MMARYTSRLPMAVSALLSVFLLCSFPGLGRAADDDASVLITEIGRMNNESLLWGPYRPNLYFGVRPRIAKSFMGGITWARVDDITDAHGNFRHTCEQHHNMDGYGWDEYDTRTGGQQTIHDRGNKIDITTSFVKIPGGKHGGSWGFRVKGVPREDAPLDLKTNIMFHATLEGLGSLEIENKNDPLGFEGDVVIKGDSDGLGDYKVRITKGTGEHPDDQHHRDSYEKNPLDRTRVLSKLFPEEILWQFRGILFRQIKDQIDSYIADYGEENTLPPWQVYAIPHQPGSGNLQIVSKTFEGPFEFDVLFSSGSADHEITSEDITKEIQSVTESFRERFARIFTPSAPFNDAEHLAFAKSMFSNLIGGIGFFAGDAVVDRSYASEYDEDNEGFWEAAAEARSRNQQKLEGPYELFTSIPSRPFFPRGFLWDEGFHLIPIAEWDIDLTLEIVRSWFSLMDEDGWIAREQILGQEARSKVPPEFQVQYPHYANPPTLFFILRDFIDKLIASSNGTANAEQVAMLQTSHLENTEVGIQYLKNIYPLLKRQYEWFHKTQSGDVKTYDRDAASSSEVYRWRGRTVRHVLTSGLDDYPRPQPPHPGELHVDLISWMGMMTKALKKIAGFIGETEDQAMFAKNEVNLLKNLELLHWSEKDKVYCDASIDDYEEHVLTCHKGYISLFPFLTGLLEPDSPTLPAMLDLIGDESELFSPHGLRSLSVKDEFYGTDENYWRGPVWMNMNYLAVEQLLRFAQTPGPEQSRAKDLYTRLRKNLVDTVFESWKNTGFAWEQYNPETGAGQRTQHFTGWTSLIVKIMSFPDLESGTSGHDEL